MSRALSDDLRIRVLAASSDGMSARSAAARFGIGISTAIAWIANARQGQLTAGKQGRRSGSRLDEHEAFIVGLIDYEKDITLNEMVLRLSEERSVVIGRSALDEWLRKRGWTFKKRPHMTFDIFDSDLCFLLATGYAPKLWRPVLRGHAVTGDIISPIRKLGEAKRRATSQDAADAAEP